MIVYLDANIIIHVVEKHPLWGPKALARIAQLHAGGDQIAVGDASRLECLVGPYQSGDKVSLADYHVFFQDPALLVFPITAAVCERAAIFAPYTASNRSTRCTSPRPSKTLVAAS